MLTVVEFGRELIRTGDLDPVYVLVHHAELERDLLRQWLLAYWCFYHVGTASWICSGDYWDRMETAAGSKEYPRSSERRHFRGANAANSVKYLKGRGVSALFKELTDCGGIAREVMAAVRRWNGFGPWIAFKVADMVERIGHLHVRFDQADTIYDSPREAAELLWEEAGRPGDNAIAWAVGGILDGLSDLTAPPLHDRPPSFQEAETVLCKYKSYRNGRYHVGEDVEACRKGLLRFSRCNISQRLLRAGKIGKLWG